MVLMRSQFLKGLKSIYRYFSSETIQYPTGGMQVPPQYGGYANAGDTQGPPPPQYGGYGTGMNDPGGFYSSNAGE